MHPVPWVHHNLTFLIYAKIHEDQTDVMQAQLDLPSNDFPVKMLTLVDAARKNRKVQAKVCIPKQSDNATQRWPLYIFGHGFDCKPEDYAYFCKIAVVVLPFETNFTFVDWNTKSLAEDASFLTRELPLLAKQDPTFLLHDVLDGVVVLGGHSMGGGTSVLAAAQSSAVGMALFAPGLYTLPPARPYLKNVTLPSLIVSGSDDCGPNQLPKQAMPTFDGLASTQKVIVSLKGANHCQWTAPSKGEIGVCNVPSAFKECALIDASTQHSLGVELFAAFLMGVKGEQGWKSFEGALALGEQTGKWTYFSSKTSPASKKLHNDCPCKKEVII